MSEEVYRGAPAHPGGASLIVTTTNDIPGYRVAEYLGIVRGIVVRSAGIGQSLMGGLRQLGGGNIPEYVQVCPSGEDDA